MRWLALVGLCVLLLVTSGCGGDGDGETILLPTIEETTGTEDSDELIPFAAPSANLAPPNSADLCAGGDLEGCFDINGMQSYADAVLQLIFQFNEDTYTAMPWPSQVMYVPVGYIGTSGCPDSSGAPGSYTDMSYAYCTGDQTIYLGQGQLYQFYLLGDGAPAVGIAHEFGHHVQFQAGLFDYVDALVAQGNDSQTLNIGLENQADCIAGAWTRWAIEKGYFKQDDMVDTALLIPEIASSELDVDRDHGTIQERANSFDHGLFNGIYGCNDFFPDKPVATP